MIRQPNTDHHGSFFGNMRTRAEIIAFNAGIDAVAHLAAASADVMRRRLVEKPTRYAYAIAALDGVAEAAAALRLPLPPDGTEPAADTVPPSPPPPRFTDGAKVLEEAS